MADAARTPGTRHRSAARCTVTAYDVWREARADVFVGPAVQHRNTTDVLITLEGLVPVTTRSQFDVIVERTRGVP